MGNSNVPILEASVHQGLDRAHSASSMAISKEGGPGPPIKALVLGQQLSNGPPSLPPSFGPSLLLVDMFQVSHFKWEVHGTMSPGGTVSRAGTTQRVGGGAHDRPCCRLSWTCCVSV